MGLRFRKSFKIAPGVRYNVGKKSHGISIGGRSGGISFNSKSGAHTRVSIPGTGISYTTKLGGKKKRKKSSKRKLTRTAYPPKARTTQPQSTAATTTPAPIPKSYTVVEPTILSYNTLYNREIIFLVACILSLLVGLIKILSHGIIFIICGLYCLYKYFDYKKKMNNYDEYVTKLENSIPPSVAIGTIVTPELNIKIINDCMNVITTTNKPIIFFEQCALVESKIDELIAIDGADCPQSPYTMKDNFVTNKQQYIHDMIERSFADTYQNAASLKTDKGKLNRYNNLFSSFEPYYNLMDEKNIVLVNTLYNNLITQ